MHHMTPADARADLAQRLDAIQSVLGGEWVNHDSPVAEGCDVPSESGFYYEGGRRRTEIMDDYDSAAKRAVAYLTDHDYTVETAQFQPTQRIITATAPNGTSIYIALQSFENLITGEGPCNEGNWGDVRRQDARRVQEQRRNTPTPEAAPGG